MTRQSARRSKEDIRFYIDDETNQPHVYNHDVDEDEVLDVLLNRSGTYVEDRGSRVAMGQTQGGRYLKIIYVPAPGKPSLFVITAYDLDGNSLKAFRRSRRTK